MYKPGDEVTTFLTGVNFQDRQSIIEQLSPGDTLILVREPDSAFQPHEIKVLYEGQIVGMIKRSLAVEIAPILDQHARGARKETLAYVVEITRYQQDSIGVEIDFTLPGKLEATSEQSLAELEIRLSRLENPPAPSHKKKNKTLKLWQIAFLAGIGGAGLTAAAKSQRPPLAPQYGVDAYVNDCFYSTITAFFMYAALAVMIIMLIRWVRKSKRNLQIAVGIFMAGIIGIIILIGWVEDGGLVKLASSIQTETPIKYNTVAVPTALPTRTRKPTVKTTFWPTITVEPHVTYVAHYLGDSSPSLDNCDSWDTITLADVGSRKCVYGKVIDQDYNNEVLYLLFGRRHNDFYMISYGDWYYPGVEGDCVFAEKNRTTWYRPGHGH